MRRTRSIALVLGLAVPFAELGHAIAYWPHVPGSGSHFYFQAVLEASGVLVAVLLLTALSVLGAARVLEGRRREQSAWSFALLFYSLLAVQLTTFLLQESLEARSLPSAATLTVGLIGQQPVALAGAFLLSWLSARLGPAIATLLAPGRPQATVQAPLLPASPQHPSPPPPHPTRTFRTWQQRAPPSALLV
jgi:hypothetical protein